MAASDRAQERRAALTCAALVVLIGLVTAAIGTRVSAWALDETLFRVSAVHYSSGLPDTVIHDLTARATSRLYALTLMPLFANLDGDQAVRAAKLWNCVLWCSTAIPLWLLAKPVLTPWRRTAAVTLAIATPWITLTTALFTESIALPAFVWFTYAALYAVRKPAWWRDLLALTALGVAVAGRVQLVGLFAGYVALILIDCWHRFKSNGRGPVWWRLRRFAVHLRNYPATVVACVIGVFGLYLVAKGQVNLHGPSLAGAYSTPLDRSVLVQDGFPMVLIETLAISFGLGVVAVLFAVPWYVRTLADGLRDDGWWFAAATVCVGVALVAFTGVAQGAFTGPATEERYWMYPAVFAWIGALAAVQWHRPQPRDIAIVGVILVVVAATLKVPRVIDPESVFLAPVLATLGDATDRTIKPITSASRDQVAIAMLLITGAVYLCLRRAPWLDPLWLLAGGAVLQLALTAVPLLAIDGAITDKVDRTTDNFAALSWVDHATTRPVDWLASEPHADGDALSRWQRDTLFWNRRIDSRGAVVNSSPQPDTTPLDALPQRVLDVKPRTGALQGPSPGVAVVWKDSPYLQVKGTEIAADSDSGLRLVDTGPRPALQFRSKGLSPGERVPVGRDVTLYVWPANGKGARLMLALGPVGAGGRVRVSGGGSARVVRIPDVGSARVAVDACGSHPIVVLRGLTGGKTAAGERLPDAAVLSAVEVTAAGRC